MGTGVRVPQKFLRALADAGGQPIGVHVLKRQINVGSVATVRRYAVQSQLDGIAVFDEDADTVTPIAKEPDDMAGATSQAAKPSIESLQAQVNDLLAWKQQYEQEAAARQKAEAPTEEAAPEHGLCQDGKCKPCAEARQKVRDEAAHEITHGLARVAEWAGLTSEHTAISAAVDRWVKAGQPAEGQESVVDARLYAGVR